MGLSATRAPFTPAPGTRSRTKSQLEERNRAWAGLLKDSYMYFFQTGVRHCLTAEFVLGCTKLDVLPQRQHTRFSIHQNVGRGPRSPRARVSPSC